MNEAVQSPVLSARRSRGLALLLATITALAIMSAVSWWRYVSERDAISGLPDKERTAFYERTLHTLQTACAKGNEGLAEYCERQADLIVQFPECDQACQKLAQSHKARPTR